MFQKDHLLQSREFHLPQMNEKQLNSNSGTPKDTSKSGRSVYVINSYRGKYLDINERLSEQDFGGSKGASISNGCLDNNKTSSKKYANLGKLKYGS